MYRDELQDDEDLRVEIFHLKKQLSNINAENHLLKVKIRKLQNEIVKKDKQMDVVLDPRKSNDIRKVLYERSASFVLNIKEKNDELLHLLREKDVIIRRLQNQLDITRLYSQPQKRQSQCKCADHIELDNKIRQVQQKIACNKSSTSSASSLEENDKKKKRSLSWNLGLFEVDSTLIENIELEEDENSARNKDNSSQDVKEQYKSLSRDHLLSIIENLKNNQRYSPSSRQASSRKSSPESDLERIELLCESPHEEIQQLHLHFLDMISEVDHLKNRIAELQNSQEKTEHVLYKKNTNIDKLAQEIKNLKRPKPRNKSNKNRGNRPYSCTDLVAKVYSSNYSNSNNKPCPRYEKERIKNKSNEDIANNFKPNKPERLDKHENRPRLKLRKQSMKDATTQIEEAESDAIQCVYIEKGSVKITEKATSDKEKEDECEYDDEVFEECDEESVPN